MKTDDSIKEVVVAAIRRHGMDLETWVRTRLWDDAEAEWTKELSIRCPLLSGELPILVSYCDADRWTFVTTRRIWSCDEGNLSSVGVSEVADHRYGNFKGYGGQTVERMTLVLRDGSVQCCPFETGKPSMGTIYAVKTLLQTATS